MAFLQGSRRPDGRFWILFFLVSALVSGCGDPLEPIKIGFLGGVSGRVADLGTEGRNGVMLAVEDLNEQGGIAGRPLQLVVRDDHQDPGIAQKKMQELVDAGAIAVLGPMNSAMAMAAVPVANRTETVLIGITVTTKALSGKDDYFVRVVGTTQSHVDNTAKLLLDRGVRRVAVVMDNDNKAYGESWTEDFAAALGRRGAEVANTYSFFSGGETDFAGLARSLLETDPDGVAFVTGAIDAAMLATHVRKFDREVTLIGAEWSATEQLIDLGGTAVEGMITAQYFDRHSQQPRYLAFRERYKQRYGFEPGFASMVAYNAALVLFEALKHRRDGESPRDAMIRLARFDVLQVQVELDAFGDTSNVNHLTEIRDGRYQVVTN